MTERMLNDIAKDIQDGQGCKIADELNLLSLTDRTNVLKAANGLVPASAGSSFEASNARDSSHLAIVSSSIPGSWKSQYLFHEDHRMSRNASTITCNDYDMKTGTLQQSKTVQHPYVTKLD